MAITIEIVYMLNETTVDNEEIVKSYGSSRLLTWTNHRLILTDSTKANRIKKLTPQTIECNSGECCVSVQSFNKALDKCLHCNIVCDCLCLAKLHRE